MFKKLALLAILLIGLGKSYAQNDEQGLIYSSEAKLFFPVVMEFRINVSTIAEEIREGRLILNQASGYEAVFPITTGIAQSDDFASDLIPNLDTTDILKIVRFDGETAPRPFEPLNYRWEVVTGSDETLSIFADQILFQPSDGEWTSDLNPPLSFYMDNPNLSLVTLRNELEAVYALLEDQTKQNPDFQFVLYDSDTEFCETITDEESGETTQTIFGQPGFPCSPEFFRNYWEQNGFQMIWSPENSFEARQNRLIETIVGEFYAEIWGENAESVPDWFLNGLSQFYRPLGDVRAVLLARNASFLNQIPPAANFGEYDPDLSEVWAAQNYLVFVYLADTFDTRVPFAVAAQFSEVDSLDEAFEAVIGRDFEEVYRGWRTWIDSAGAEIAAAWNPYLATTPTATPTRTLTPIPPSPTHTLTPTITVTPTSTSLVGRIRTPIPTNTPLPATASFTPSNTPLPAGSLRTPTQVPATPAEPQEDSRTLPCGASATLIPVIGIVFATRQRKKLR